MRGQDILRGLPGHTRKASFAAWQAHMRCLRQPKRVVVVQEQAKHIWPANDGDGAGWRAGKVAGSFKIGAGGIPQNSLRVRWIGRERGDTVGQDDALALGRVRLVFVRVSTVDDQ